MVQIKLAMFSKTLECDSLYMTWAWVFSCCVAGCTEEIYMGGDVLLAEMVARCLTGIKE